MGAGLDGGIGGKGVIVQKMGEDLRLTNTSILCTHDTYPKCTPIYFIAMYVEW